MSRSILYEQPLSERIRAFLRLEHLFSQASHFHKGKSLWDSHATISALVEILTVLDRIDMRSEILKELDRNITGLSRLLDTPAVDRHRLNSALEKLTSQLYKIQQLPSKFGTEIRDSELLNSVRQRTAILGGTCGFDIPAYHYWLHRSYSLKTERLSNWLLEIEPFKEGIELLLNMMRNSALFEPQVSSENGFFQKSFDQQNACQLLRISLPAECKAFPEVSGNKHRVNVRFLSYEGNARPKQINFPLEFELSCCAI